MKRRKEDRKLKKKRLKLKRERKMKQNRMRRERKDEIQKYDSNERGREREETTFD